MATTWKETLLPGEQVTANGTRFTVLGRHIIEAHRNLQRFKQLKLPVAVAMEHQPIWPDDDAAYRERFARAVVGHVIDSRVSSRGTLETLLQIDDADVQQARKCRYVSPTIHLSGWFDSYGRRFSGCCPTMIAITPVPIQYRQKPFELSTAGPVRLKGITLSTTSPRGSPMNDKLKQLADAIRSLGHTIPQEAEGSIDLLIVAVKSNGDGNDLDADGDDLDLDAPAAGDTAAPPGGPPMMLSRTRRPIPTAQDRVVHEQGKLARKHSYKRS